MDITKKGVSAFANFMGKKVHDLSQGVRGFIPICSKLSNLTSLDEKFTCPLHPSKFVKYFVLQSSSSSKESPLLCEYCATWFKVHSASDSDLNDAKSPEDYTLLLPITELPELISSRYEEVKDRHDLRNINNAILEAFLEKEQEMQHKVSQHIADQQQQLNEQVETLIELFTSQLYRLKDQISFLFSKELETYKQNLKYTREHVNSFINSLKVFEKIPKREDLEKGVDELSSFESLSSFIREHTNRLSTLFSSLQFLDSSSSAKSTSSDGDYTLTSNYKYTLHLLKKIHHTLQSPPKNPISANLEYRPTESMHLPNQFLMQVLAQFAEPHTIPSFRLDNSIERLEKLVTFDTYKLTTKETKAFQIDTMDSFYSNTPKEVQCLHYYNPDEKSLCLLNLAEIVSVTKESGRKDIASMMLKVPLPPALKVSRQAKTIAASDGTIYFIGGEGSSKTLSFEYRRSLNMFREPKRNSSDDKFEAVEELPTIQVPFSFKRTQESETDHEIEILGQAFFSVRAKMNQVRSGHSLVFVGNDTIYAISGFGASRRDEYTTKCERYLINENRWINIRNCNYGVSHPGVCSFDDKYIYKFGGFAGQTGQVLDKVERYDIVKDKWMDIPITLGNGAQNMMLPKSLALQINDHDIILVGGQTDAFLLSDSCKSLRVDGNQMEWVVTEDEPKREEPEIYADEDVEESVDQLTEMKLPVDGRIIHQTVVYEGKLFCLVTKPSLHEAKQSIFSFDGSEWTIAI